MEQFVFSENALTILQTRYFQKGENANTLFRRVADSIAKGEKPGLEDYWSNQFYDLMISGRFIPNSPTLVNAGNGKGCLSACFVVSPEDTMESIMQVAYDAAMIEKWGGGIGFGFSKLRPKNDAIQTTHGRACGPVAVMKLYSAVGSTITQGAFRLGAHMGQLIVSHPDIREFIHVKDHDDTLSNFNISVQITDEFMRAVIEDIPFALRNPRTNEAMEWVAARDLWKEICESAWKTGDPGVVFIDEVWGTAPNPQLGKIQTSNPCGEEQLENYGNCCLGSIDIGKYVSPNKTFDYAELDRDVRVATRFLDDVIEVNTFPLPILREMNLKTRRIGLGAMGFADALARMELAYDSPEGVQFAANVSKVMKDSAWDASRLLAQERGAFPEYPNSALKDIMGYPVRHSSVITIAPTGTISRIANCSSGIEPYFALAWYSNVLWQNQDGSSTRLLDAPTPLVEKLNGMMSKEQVQEVLMSLAENPHVAHRILEQYGIDSRFYRTTNEISPFYHVRMQSTWQTNVTNSVSKTINMPNNVSVDDISNAFVQAWNEKCKAVTVYRDGSKSMQVLETGRLSEPEEELEGSDLDVYALDTSEDLVDLCPFCSLKLVQHEGCSECLACGYQKCSL